MILKGSIIYPGISSKLTTTNPGYALDVVIQTGLGMKIVIAVVDIDQSMKTKIPLIIIFFLCSACFLFSSNVKEIIEKIPSEERIDLERVFFQLVCHENFGYTLFGDKPVSLGAFFRVTPWENVVECGECHELFWKRWTTWEKHKNLFSIHQYILLQESGSISDLLILINKKTFIKFLQKNLNIFEAILKTTIDPEQFLAKIETREVSFLESLQNNDMLLGMCLGYGEWNARLYHHRGKIFKNDCFKPFEYHKHYLCRIPSVHFIADNSHKETKRLKEKYDKLRGKVSAIYATGHFLETTLEKLTETKEHEFKRRKMKNL